MTLQEAHRLCKEQKEQAMARYESSEDTFKKHDSSMAVNAWDEMLGQLHKPNGTSQKRLQKTKEGALRIIALIADTDYKQKMKDKIESIDIS